MQCERGSGHSVCSVGGGVATIFILIYLKLCESKAELKEQLQSTVLHDPSEQEC